MNPILSSDTLSHAGIAIEEVDFTQVSADDVGAWLAYDRVMTRESPVTPFEVSRARIQFLPDFMSLRLFVARDADRAIVGESRALIPRTANNAHICQTHVSVRADWRRRGLGTALLHRVLAAAEIESRSLLVGWTTDRVPAGEAFATHIGAELAQRAQMNVLRLADVEPRQVQAWIDQGRQRATDYELFWIDGAYPDDLLAAITDVRNTMLTATRGALELEPPVLTPEQLGEANRRAGASGIEYWALFARHALTHELVGFTEVEYHPAQPAIVRQGGTAVRPAHRGHGLGTWLKAAMIARLLAERPAAEEITTGNASANDAMVSLNHTLGFTCREVATAWQGTRSRIGARVAYGDPPHDQPCDRVHDLP